MKVLHIQHWNPPLIPILVCCSDIVLDQSTDFVGQKSQKKFGCILQHSFFSFLAVYAMIRILQFLWFLFLFIFHVSCLTSKVILQKKIQTDIPFHFSYIYFHTYLSHIVEINLTLKCCCNKVNY